MRETERLSARGERSRRRTVSVPTICRYTVSAEGGRKKKREKKNLESSSSARCRPLVISSSAGDFFSLRGEKERGNVQKGYRLKESCFATKTPTPKPKEHANRARVPQTSGLANSIDPMKEAAITAAYKIADAEAKSFLASEAVKEAEKISKMAEETDSLLLLAKEIFERCNRIYD
ncbi:hypothetical protein GW17_00010977 [Ensete ventricosum]|nr:hypothetical protein GW17_00010977 [Ensete ventricosum]